MIRKTMTALAIGALGLSSTACNTVKGLGEDIKSVGEAGEDVISEAPSPAQDAQDAR